VSNIYLVLGCPRSGTSLVAGLLHKNGISMGAWFGGVAEQNPRGFFEDRNFADVNNAILESMVAPEHQPRPYLHPPNEEQLARVMDCFNLRGKVAGRIENGRRTGADWGIKDPRIVLLWALYRSFFQDDLPVRIIATHRNPLSVARSWLKYGRLADLEYGLRLANEYERRLCGIVNTCHWPVLHVGFEDWWQHPERQRAELDGFVGRALDYAHFDAGLWRA